MSADAYAALQQALHAFERMVINRPVVLQLQAAGAAACEIPIWNYASLPDKGAG